ncbi:hypothetical protein B5M09_010318 [Aphanomyces astaci]|nr:hypothetical protein B5M09_010318 [Aphanomyces astaci]
MPNFASAPLGSDLAILKLDAPSTKRPVALSKQWVHPNTTTVTFGWGQCSLSEPSSYHLLQANLTTIANAACQRRIRTASNDSVYTTWNATASHLCAGGVTGTGTCYGDSGGPLVAHPYLDTNLSLSQIVLVGIVSFGVKCADGVPDVFTRVSATATFIDEHVTGHRWVE